MATAVAFIILVGAFVIGWLGGQAQGKLDLMREQSLLVEAKAIAKATAPIRYDYDETSSDA